MRARWFVAISTSVAILSLTGACGGGSASSAPPAYVPVVPDFEVAGSWYKIGREIGSGTEYQFPMTVSAHAAGTFVSTVTGQPAADKMITVDRSHVYMVAPGNTLLAMWESSEGLNAEVTAGDGAQGFVSMPAYMGSYSPGSYASDDRDDMGVMFNTDLFGHAAQLSIWRTGSEILGHDLFVLDFDGEGGRSIGVGWWIGERFDERLIVSADVASLRTAWDENRGGEAWRVVRTQAAPTAVLLGTFDAEGDRMWGTVYERSTADGGAEHQWIELWSRTAITMDDFYAAACAHGFESDCGRAPAMPAPAPVGTYDSGVDDARAFGEMTAQEARTACESLVRYMGARLPPSRQEEIRCTLLALAGTTTPDACRASAASCLAGDRGRLLDEVDCDSAQIDPTCTAPVREVEACIGADADAYVDRLAAIRCDLAGDPAQLEHLRQPVPVPSQCAALSTCPAYQDGALPR